MKTLNLKKEVIFEKNKVYSICLIGARRFEKTHNKDLLIYYNTNPEKQVYAMVAGQQQFIYKDLNNLDCWDNYDKDARTLKGLKQAMIDVYNREIDEREIVTILRFKVID